VELTLEEAYHGTSRRLQIETGPRAQKAPRSVQVKIPRGVTDGSRVRLAGQGGPGVGGGPPGDLYLEVRLRPHRLFRVDGHDLSCELPVRDDEAALGATVDAPTLEGRVSVKIPPGSQSGSHLRLKEKGVPHLHGAGRGDLYYTLKIVTPAALTVEEKELIQQLRGLREQQGARANPRHALFS
jgi:curved DNA-binding protein